MLLERDKKSVSMRRALQQDLVPQYENTRNSCIAKLIIEKRNRFSIPLCKLTHQTFALTEPSAVFLRNPDGLQAIIGVETWCNKLPLDPLPLALVEWNDRAASGGDGFLDGMLKMEFLRKSLVNFLTSHFHAP